MVTFKSRRSLKGRERKRRTVWLLFHGPEQTIPFKNGSSFKDMIMRSLNDNIKSCLYKKKTQQSFNYTNEGLYTWQIFFKRL